MMDSISRQGLPLALALALTFTLVGTPSLSADSEAKLIASTPIRPIFRNGQFDNMWPGDKDRDALVFLNIAVDVAGNVVTVSPREGGFHEQRFVDAAIKMARKMKFQPATTNGVPAPYSGVVPFRFMVDYGSGSNTRGVLPEFRAELNKVEKLIEAKDFTGAHFHAQWMLSEKVRLMYEYSALNATLATTNYRVGNIFQAISAARLATARTGMVLEQYEPGGPLPKVRERDFLLQKKVIEPYLRLRFVLDTAKGAYVDALHAGADAQALGLLPPDDPMLKQFEAVVMKVQHADALRADAEIGPDQEWKHEPLFRNFTLRDLKGGTLERIRIECRGDGVDQPYVPGAEIHLPTDANTCTLTFKGSPGTTFQIAEYRSPLRG